MEEILPHARSPQFIYMQSLHSILKQNVIIEGEPLDGEEGGTLLANSMEGKDVGGRGFYESGFEFAERNKLQFVLTIPKEKGIAIVSSAELWLFPNLDALREPATLLKMTLLVEVTLPEANMPRRQQIIYTWRTDESCVVLDMTALTKRITNFMRKHNPEETNATISVEVVTVGESGLQNSTLEEGLRNVQLVATCDQLNQSRSENTPFLAVKYYNDSEMGGTEYSSDEEEWQRTARDTVVSSSSSPASSEDAESQSQPSGNCSLVPLLANLTEVYGGFVIQPQVEDIKACKGTCSGFQRYSTHALVKERLNWLSGGLNRLTVTCVPTAFKPLEFLIFQNGYLLIVKFRDIIAQECGCR